MGGRFASVRLFHDGTHNESTRVSWSAPVPNWLWKSTGAVGRATALGLSPQHTRCAFGLVIGVVTAPTCFFTGLQCIVTVVVAARMFGGANVAAGERFMRTAGAVAGNDGAPLGRGALAAT